MRDSLGGAFFFRKGKDFVAWDPSLNQYDQMLS